VQAIFRLKSIQILQAMLKVNSIDTLQAKYEMKSKEVLLSVCGESFSRRLQPDRLRRLFTYVTTQ
jgi:hypothetical protein